MNKEAYTQLQQRQVSSEGKPKLCTSVSLSQRPRHPKYLSAKQLEVPDLHTQDFPSAPPIHLAITPTHAALGPACQSPPSPYRALSKAQIGTLVPL